jgi:DNA primase
VLLGLLVRYPDFMEEKSDQISALQFSPQLEEFRQALNDLLIMHNEISVQSIYSRLTSTFYKVLQEIHGEKTEGRPWGHRLFELFPILKADPPREFISQCIDHFVHILHVKQMAQDIETLKAAASGPSADADHASDRLLTLIRDFQLQHELINSNDSVLAEEAMTIRRVWAPTEWSVAA